jgi:hypothetical protein
MQQPKLKLQTFKYLEPKSWVQIVTRLQATHQKDHGSIPGRGKTCLFSKAPSPALGPTQPLIQWLSRAISHGHRMRLPLTPSSTNIKNQWSCTPLLLHPSSQHAQGFYCLVLSFNVQIFRQETKR